MIIIVIVITTNYIGPLFIWFFSFVFFYLELILSNANFLPKLSLIWSQSIRTGRDLLRGNWVNLVSGKLKQRRTDFQEFRRNSWWVEKVIRFFHAKIFFEFEFVFESQWAFLLSTEVNPAMT